MANGETQARQRDQFGKFIKITSNIPPLVQKSSFKSAYPDLIDVRITNPITYLKLWFSQFFKNSEISINIKIRPMALISIAIAIAIILGGTGFSIFYFLLGGIRGF